jgi:hypothetical protein
MDFFKWDDDDNGFFKWDDDFNFNFNFNFNPNPRSELLFMNK